MATKSRKAVSSKNTPDGWPRLVPAAGRVIYVRKPDATVTEDDRRQAQAYLSNIRADHWNPWRLDDEAEAIESAETILAQWIETGGATIEEIDAWMAAWDEHAEQEHRRRENDRVRRRLSYDPAREADRLALLEVQSILRQVEAEEASMGSGLRYPATSMDRRTDGLSQSAAKKLQLTRRADELRSRVADPELVVDEQGQLPSDRRAWSRIAFECRRRTTVIDLHAKRQAAQADVDAATKGQRRDPLARVRDIQSRLDFWLEISEPAVEDMCADCAVPSAWHVWTTGGLQALVGYGPCPAYPGQRAIRRKVIAILETSGRLEMPDDVPPPPKERRDPRTKAQLLEEIDRLQNLIAEQASVVTSVPDAVMRRADKVP